METEISISFVTVAWEERCRFGFFFLHTAMCDCKVQNWNCIKWLSNVQWAPGSKCNVTWRRRKRQLDALSLGLPPSPPLPATNRHRAARIVQFVSNRPFKIVELQLSNKRWIKLRLIWILWRTEWMLLEPYV